MKKIKIQYCDGLAPENDLVFLPLLQKHYEVEFSDTPDYLFYGPFGKDHLTYRCVKIFTTGECVVPDFNECDYATGFDYLTLGDRYIRLPLSHIMFHDGVNMMELARRRGEGLPPVEAKKFCSFVVSNPNAMPEREAFFRLLTRYKPVDSGGRFLNNLGGGVENKLLFDHQHKFSICFENEAYPGYTTEKLTEAFAAGCIPIYYGDPLVERVFNPKAFIHCRNFSGFEEVVEKVRQLDEDDALYRAMLSEPVLLEEDDYFLRLEAFLCHIMDQPMSEARRTPHAPLAAAVELQFGLKDWLRLKNRRFRRSIRKLLR